jgi:hypothetical protein
MTEIMQWSRNSTDILCIINAYIEKRKLQNIVQTGLYVGT